MCGLNNFDAIGPYQPHRTDLKGYNCYLAINTAQVKAPLVL